MKKIFLIYSWLLLSLGIILISAATIYVYTQNRHLWRQQPSSQKTEDSEPKTANDLVALDKVKGIKTFTEVKDARVAIIANFLERYNSPLKPYEHFAQVFVDLADQNGFDFRLLPAIAMQESNLCKKIPPQSYNCLGFGIHSRGTLTFPNFEANFTRAARELKANYIDQGLTTPYQIMKKYTPGSNGSWAKSVNQWMAEMKYDDRQKGREEKKDASVLEFVPE